MAHKAAKMFVELCRYHETRHGFRVVHRRRATGESKHMYKLTGVSMPEGLAEREKGADLLHLPCGVVLFLHKLRYSDGVAKDVVLSGHGTCVGNYVHTQSD